MLTNISIQNFKRFANANIPLSSPVVFVGPNNSGKTTALQALALWQLGLSTWIEKRGVKRVTGQRTGVVLNRKDIVQLPMPTTALLWRDLHLRGTPEGTTKATDNVLIVISVEGIAEGRAWKCALEFDYSNDEIVYCRPVRDRDNNTRAEIAEEATKVIVAFLPPMSGLTSNERRIDEGAIQVSLGEGQTAQVLRNLCWKLWEVEHEKAGKGEWQSLVEQIEHLFGATLNAPTYVVARGEIQMSYQELVGPGRRKCELDLSAAGRGLQQTLLLLAFLRWKPGAVLLIDEPDAHLEILRQRQIYGELCDTARRLGSQLILATHSEVVLNEAQKDQIVAFVGQPHSLQKNHQLLKALALLGYEQFLQAEITGWVLYLEGSTDLESLRKLAKKLNHPARSSLEKPFVHYVCNQPVKARQHFFGLREAYPELRGVGVFDNSPDAVIQTDSELREMKLTRRELENYFCSPDLLRRWVAGDPFSLDLFGQAELEGRRRAMESAIVENTIPAALQNPSHQFWYTNKVSDDYLPSVFNSFFTSVGLRNTMSKADYAELAELLTPEEIDTELIGVLDSIAEVGRAPER